MKVTEALPEDYGKGIARITHGAMQAIGAKEGDILEIRRVGTQKGIIPARCKEFWFDPNDKTIINEYEAYLPIRIDEFLRRSLGNNDHESIRIGDAVEVRKITKHIRDARHVTIAPLQPMTLVDNRYFSKAWHDMVVVKDEVIRLNYYGKELTFRIVRTELLDDDTPEKRKRYEKALLDTENPVIIKVTKTLIATTVHRPEIRATGSFGIRGLEDKEDGPLEQQDVKATKEFGSAIVSFSFRLEYEGQVQEGEFQKSVKNVDKQFLFSSPDNPLLQPYLDGCSNEVDKANRRLIDNRIVSADLNNEQKAEMLKDLKDRILVKWEEIWKEKNN